MIKLYTDGSYKDGVVGSGGVILMEDRAPVYYKGVYYEELFTAMHNVGGEILAVLKGIDMIKNMTNDYVPVCIYHDYIGIKKWYTEEWRATKQGTQYYHDIMWRDYEPYFDISFQKVKAHSGDRWNETADRLAKEAIGI